MKILLKKSLIVTGCLLTLGLIAIWLIWGIYFSSQITYAGKIFEIKKGERFLDIALHLEQNKLIKSKWFFDLYGIYTSKYKKIQPGKYELSPSFSVAQMLDKIARGEFIKERVRVQEGWSIQDIAKELKNKQLISALDFTTTTKTVDFTEQFPFLTDKPKDVGLEGYIFPDTYDIRADASAVEIIQTTLHNFDNKLTPEIRKQIADQKKTYFEIITMASILEKEVMLYSDKQIVAGILWKRIEEGWPLQVDATLAYFTGRYSMELTKKDLATDSPYNTYKHKGLPKGPICNPGINSIKAAIDYHKTPYWFYMSKPDGTVLYSKTLAEQNANRQIHWSKYDQ
ncbi:MAG: endolytic transglycosylase MltG [Candidatus Gribaldobacteria bacterium]|nr:endolytic transglycosylase MltG [Candidatus Gribaldobacteria bacterium]